MKYYIQYRINAYFYAEVEADSYEQANKIAEGEFCCADFGAAEEIEGEMIFAKDENGKILFEV